MKSKQTKVAKKTYTLKELSEGIDYIFDALEKHLDLIDNGTEMMRDFHRELQEIKKSLNKEKIN